MHFDRLDLNLLKVFEAIFLERHLTRAGERLGVAQPTVSKALARLREAFNDPLFIRTAEGMQPTPLAEAVAEQVLDALRRLRAGLEQSVHFDPDRSTRRFNIAMTDYPGAVLLPSLVPRLRAFAPKVDLTVHHLRREDAHDALKSGRLDVVITDTLEGAGLFQRTIYRERFVTLVRTGHPTIGDTLSLETFLAVDHLLFSPTGRGGGVIDALLAERGARRRVAVRVPHVAVIPSIIAQSDLVVTLPERVAHEFQTQRGLRILPPPIEVPAYSVRQYWHEKYHREPANQWLRNLISELPAG